MGINSLWIALKEYTGRGHLRQFEGKRVAVDTYVWLHSAASVCGVSLHVKEFLRYCDAQNEKKKKAKHEKEQEAERRLARQGENEESVACKNEGEQELESTTSLPVSEEDRMYVPQKEEKKEEDSDATTQDEEFEMAQEETRRRSEENGANSSAPISVKKETTVETLEQKNSQDTEDWNRKEQDKQKEDDDDDDELTRWRRDMIRFNFSFLDYVVKRVDYLQSFGVIPVCVFDGRPMPLKKETNAKRRQQREEHFLNAMKMLMPYQQHIATAFSHAQTMHRPCPFSTTTPKSLTRPTSEQTKEEEAEVWERDPMMGDLFMYLPSDTLKRQVMEELSKAFDITTELAAAVMTVLKEDRHVECLVAPYEADSQMSYLCHRGYVSACLSEDSDLIAYFCPQIIAKTRGNGNMGGGGGGGNGSCEVIHPAIACPAFFEAFVQKKISNSSSGGKHARSSPTSNSSSSGGGGNDTKRRKLEGHPGEEVPFSSTFSPFLISSPMLKGIPPIHGGGGRPTTSMGTTAFTTAASSPSSSSCPPSPFLPSPLSGETRGGPWTRTETCSPSSSPTLGLPTNWTSSTTTTVRHPTSGPSSAFSYARFLLACIMAGCDYVPNLSNIGFKKAYCIIARCEHMGDLYRILTSEYTFSPEEVRAYLKKVYKAYYAFTHHIVYCPFQKELVYFNGASTLESSPIVHHHAMKHSNEIDSIHDFPSGSASSSSSSPSLSTIGPASFFRALEEIVGIRWEKSLAQETCERGQRDPTTLAPYSSFYHRTLVQPYWRYTRKGQQRLTSFEVFSKHSHGSVVHRSVDAVNPSLPPLLLHSSSNCSSGSNSSSGRNSMVSTQSLSRTSSSGPGPLPPSDPRTGVTSGEGEDESHAPPASPSSSPSSSSSRVTMPNNSTGEKHNPSLLHPSSSFLGGGGYCGHHPLSRPVRKRPMMVVVRSCFFGSRKKHGDGGWSAMAGRVFSHDEEEDDEEEEDESEASLQSTAFLASPAMAVLPLKDTTITTTTTCARGAGSTSTPDRNPTAAGASLSHTSSSSSSSHGPITSSSLLSSPVSLSLPPKKPVSSSSGSTMSMLSSSSDGEERGSLMGCSPTASALSSPPEEEEEATLDSSFYDYLDETQEAKNEGEEKRLSLLKDRAREEAEKKTNNSLLLPHHHHQMSPSEKEEEKEHDPASQTLNSSLSMVGSTANRMFHPSPTPILEKNEKELENEDEEEEEVMYPGETPTPCPTLPVSWQKLDPQWKHRSTRWTATRAPPVSSRVEATSREKAETQGGGGGGAAEISDVSFENSPSCLLETKRGGEAASTGGLVDDPVQVSPPPSSVFPCRSTTTTTTTVDLSSPAPAPTPTTTPSLSTDLFDKLSFSGGSSRAGRRATMRR